MLPLPSVISVSPASTSVGGGDSNSIGSLGSRSAGGSAASGANRTSTKSRTVDAGDKQIAGDGSAKIRTSASVGSGRPRRSASGDVGSGSGGGSRSVCSDANYKSRHRSRRAGAEDGSASISFAKSTSFARKDSKDGDDESARSPLLAIVQPMAGGSKGSVSSDQSSLCSFGGILSRVNSAVFGGSKGSDSSGRKSSFGGILSRVNSAVFDLRDSNSFVQNVLGNGGSDSSLITLSVDGMAGMQGLAGAEGADGRDMYTGMPNHWIKNTTELSASCCGGIKACGPGKRNLPSQGRFAAGGGKTRFRRVARQISLVFVLSLFLVSVVFLVAVFDAGGVRNILPASTVNMAVRFQGYVLDGYGDGAKVEERKLEPSSQDQQETPQGIVADVLAVQRTLR